MKRHQSFELARLGVRGFHGPLPLVASKFTTVGVRCLEFVAPVGCDQFDAALLPTPPSVGIVGGSGDHSLQTLPLSTFGLRDSDLAGRGLRERNFMRRGTFRPDLERKTSTAVQHHPLRSLAALGFTGLKAFFFAVAKLPSRKDSSHFSKPCSSSVQGNASQALSHTPGSSHYRSRSQKVEGYSWGRNRHAAAVCRSHRMPSKQARFGAGGLPRLSRRGSGLGSKGSTTPY